MKAHSPGYAAKFLDTRKPDLDYQSSHVDEIIKTIRSGKIVRISARFYRRLTHKLASLEPADRVAYDARKDGDAVVIVPRNLATPAELVEMHYSAQRYKNVY